MWVQTGKLTPFIPAARGLSLLGPSFEAESEGREGVCVIDGAAHHRAIKAMAQTANIVLKCCMR